MGFMWVGLVIDIFFEQRRKHLLVFKHKSSVGQSCKKIMISMHKSVEEKQIALNGILWIPKGLEARKNFYQLDWQ